MTGPANPRSLVAAGQARLVNDAKFVSASVGEAGQQRRRRRFGLLRGLWDVSKERRLRACCRCRVEASRPVSVHRSPEGYAYFSNLQRCGYAGLCPVCGAKIAQARAEEIEVACTSHLNRGGGLELFMLTVPHHVGLSLEQLLDVVRLGFRRVIGGRRWAADRDRFGVLGQVRSLEATHGPNGWHPHLHVLLFTHRPLAPEERDVLQAGIYARWASHVERAGLGLPRRDLCTLGPVQSHERLSEYLTKVAGVVDDRGRVRPVGLEMSRHDLKGGRGVGRSMGHRTPFQILEGFLRTGDAMELALWFEWEACMKGKQLIRWSNGLKGLLGVAERSDEEVVEEEEGCTVAFEIATEDWECIRAVPGAIARVLEIVEAGRSPASVALYLWVLRRSVRAGPCTLAA